ncbi:MAG: hypothetical protein FWE92_06380 [Defluviitaleaceae bacterium]|nr:hypothetical protein [Defluviitaleaceae bacterium]
MNINCTENCSYQQEGKCGLNNLSNLVDLTYTGSMIGSMEFMPAMGRCPYYRI